MSSKNADIPIQVCCSLGWGIVCQTWRAGFLTEVS